MKIIPRDASNHCCKGKLKEIQHRSGNDDKLVRLTSPMRRIILKMSSKGCILAIFLACLTVFVDLTCLEGEKEVYAILD